MKPGSSIIATSSSTSFEGSEMLPDYSATKGAINPFTKVLAKQLVDKGIRVNAVAPGPADLEPHVSGHHLDGGRRRGGRRRGLRVGARGRRGDGRGLGHGRRGFWRGRARSQEHRP
jgi:NAD(P)-dependent dehydrogenase (short-subunit alcohol dehydrogenase family)